MFPTSSGDGGASGNSEVGVKGGGVEPTCTGRV